MNNTTITKEIIVLSNSECADIALHHAGEVPNSSGNGGFRCTADVQTPTGWETVVVGANGTGNQGFVVLRGTTPENRNLLRRGKINALVNCGCPEKIADVCVNLPYGMESQVWGAVIDLEPLYKSSPIEPTFGHKKFNNWVKDIYPESLPMSGPRKHSVLQILDNLAGSKGEEV